MVNAAKIGSRKSGRTKSTQLRRGLTRAAYGLFLVVTLVGLPILLIKVAGWPLPRQVPDVSNMITAVEQRNIEADVIIKTLAVLLWIIWAQLVWSLIWELVHVGPRLSKGLQAKSAPFSSSPMQRLAARLIGGLLTAGIVVSSFGSNSALPSAFVPTLQLDVAEPEEEVVENDATEVAPIQVWRVKPGDSLWSISSGDEHVMNAIFEANPTVNSALDVKPGMDLVVPLDLEVPEDRIVEHVAEETIGVVKGDHLWGIAEDRLERALPADPSEAEVADYVEQVIETNPSVLPDPNLIHPGDQYTFPTVGAPAPVEQVLPPDKSTGDAGTVENADLRGPGFLADDPAGHRTAQERDGWSVGSLLGSTQAIVLAAGLFALYLELQQHRLIRGAANTRRKEGDETSTDELIKASKLPLVEWAGKELSTMVAELSNSGEENEPPMVSEVRIGNGIEVVWQSPQQATIKGWVVSDNGRRWKHAYKPGSKVVRGPQPAAFPSLVTMGSRIVPASKEGAVEIGEYRQSVMIDLAHSGTLAIVGEDELLMSTARSIIFELGTSESLANAKVLLTNIEIEGTKHMSRVRSGPVNHAVGMLRSAAFSSSPDATVGDASMGATVIVVRAESEDLDQILAAWEPGCSCAVVVLGKTEKVNRHFIIQPDGADAFFLDNQADVLEPAAISARQAADIAETLDKVAEEENSADWSIQLDGDSAQSKAATLVQEIGSTRAAAKASPEAGPLINVLGAPRLEGVDAAISGLAAVLLVLTSPNRSMKAADVITAIWGSGTISVEEFWDEIAELNKHVSSEIISKTSDGELAVSASLRTDLELFSSYVVRSAGVGENEELILLFEALKHIRGVPFTGSPLCHWAYRPETPVALRAIELIEATASRAAEIAIDLDELSAAEQAVALGLSGTGPNEPLLRLQMRIQAMRGNLDAVETVFNNFSASLSGSPWRKEVQPSVKTVELRNKLLSAKRLSG